MSVLLSVLLSESGEIESSLAAARVARSASVKTHQILLRLSLLTMTSSNRKDKPLFLGPDDESRILSLNRIYK